MRPSLTLLSRPFFVYQTPSKEPILPELLAVLSRPDCTFGSITRTPSEVSIVCDVDLGELRLKGVEDHKWRCIQVNGPMDFSLTGIMADLTSPLKDAAVPIFAVSTYDTDYLLVPIEKVDLAVKALKDAQWVFESTE